MVQQPHHLELPVVEPEQHTKPDIVHAGLHRAVHTVQTPEVIALDRMLRMQLLVGLPMVGLLEDLEGADARLVKHAKLLN
jgi:MOSC domain-containing protein YiiM